MKLKGIPGYEIAGAALCFCYTMDLKKRKPPEGHEAAVRIANKESTRITDTPSLSL